jgi:hypothetical protein
MGKAASTPAMHVCEECKSRKLEPEAIQVIENVQGGTVNFALKGKRNHISFHAKE